MLEELCKRIQQLLRYASVITERKECWESLAQKFDWFQTLRNTELPTTCNRVCKWTQHLTSDNVASVCRGLKFTSEIDLRSSLFVYIWNDNPYPPCPQKSKDRPHRRRGDKQRLLSYEATILSFFKIRGAQNLIATGSPIIIMVKLCTRRWWISEPIPIPLDTNTVCK